MTSPLLHARGLHKAYDRTPALRGASFEVVDGEIVAVMGPSGAGKSTLLQCLAGILRPDAGEVVFDGERLDDLSDRRLTDLRRRAFGFVFPYGQLVPELPAVENVALPLVLAGRRRRAAVAEAATWFRRLDLAGLEDRQPGDLSSGQAQRVALARALVARPRILFADEPTGALDTLAGEQVMDLVSALNSEDGTTVVLVTHEPRVAAYAHREVVVRDGKVGGLVGGGAR
jgi:putative ABC transport system ATP-binding protein